ncbi:lytic murein transglycosylase [Aliifodinibius salicampi]|uniref:Lytic murein transglycosylase n=1 Tax=Fodinibius salicampi TaxID=1920655 RepID=A0ABT3PZK5_9BACT|nr:lytic murein transglycosylase [Fodinibius salicampi]MCW9713274.1 lytic murein transglycosylase [Fodinibius salicampi]
MTNLLTTFKNILSSGIILLLLGNSNIGTAHSVHEHGPNSNTGISPTIDDTISAHSKYSQALTELIDIFHKKEYQTSHLFQDERFEIYGEIDQRFKRSAERKSINLEEYKQILGFEEKKRRAVTFMQEHSDQLQKAEQEYGISKYVITAIIGIESDFGQNIGSYNPFNAYVSMYAVGYRADFAKAQLIELLDFTKRHNIDVFDLKSSYAGAMSSAQFIPYSLNKWFVGDDIFDMDNNIMSVANYLAHFQKRTNDLRTSVLRYNPSGLYADTVLALADEIKQRQLSTAAR